MAKSEYIECTYCGATNDKSSERCKKCGKYHTEDAKEFDRYINNKKIQHALSETKIFNTNIS